MSWVEEEKKAAEETINRFKIALSESREFFNAIYTQYLKIKDFTDLQKTDDIRIYFTDEWISKNEDYSKYIKLNFQRTGTLYANGRSINFALNTSNSTIYIYYSVGASNSIPLSNLSLISAEIILMWFGWILSKEKMDFDRIPADVSLAGSQPWQRRDFELSDFVIGNKILAIIEPLEKQNELYRIQTEKFRIELDKKWKKEQRKRRFRPWIRWGIAILIITILILLSD